MTVISAGLDSRVSVDCEELNLEPRVRIRGFPYIRVRVCEAKDFRVRVKVKGFPYIRGRGVVRYYGLGFVRPSDFGVRVRGSPYIRVRVRAFP